MPSDSIQYDVLAREALRHVVHDVLEMARKEGLPGEHHFFITFQTNAPGVSMSEDLRKEFPEEMTVVLQHQYWDLEVTRDQFSVKLAFGGVPAFFDPSVQFGLQFTSTPSEEEEQAPAPAPAEVDVSTDDKKPDEPGEVVSLDAFRKK